MLEELKCSNCGAALNPNTLKCEYCGSQFAKKEERGLISYIQTCPARVETLGAAVSVSEESMQYMSADQVSEYAVRQITHKLAEALTPYVKLETMRDPYTMSQIIRGTIRVVEPDFRF